MTGEKRREEKEVEERRREKRIKCSAPPLPLRTISTSFWLSCSTTLERKGK